MENNFTTIEHSNNLIESGLPSWTADCFFGGYSGHPECITIRQTESCLSHHSFYGEYPARNPAPTTLVQPELHPVPHR